MGGATSSLRQCLSDEFHRVVKDKRDYLVLGELLGIKLPYSAWTLEPAHLASLFVADRSAIRLDLISCVEFSEGPRTPVLRCSLAFSHATPCAGIMTAALALMSFMTSCRWQMTEPRDIMRTSLGLRWRRNAH